jgi:aminomethyltransferase
MTMTTELLRTPLYDWHVSHGGRMVDFAGWSMPVQYTSIAEEHEATRNAVGVFDISHMGRLELYGVNAAKFFDSIVTRRVADLKPNQIRYSLVCNDKGGVLDDVLVYAGTDDGDPFSFVVNASNRDKIRSWVCEHLPDARKPIREQSISLGDMTKASAMIAVQGPKAVEVLSPLLQNTHYRTPANLASIRNYYYERYVLGDECLTHLTISRTGYTGEDGFEIICSSEEALEIWQRLIENAAKFGGMACGLGARDTLRLEAAMPLYGHELSETINPIQAGLNFAVNLKDRKFIGSDALERFASDKSQPVRIGLQCDGKRVPRQGCPVLHNNKVVGEVTSGTYSPTLDRPIAMAYVQPSASAIGTQLTTDIRGTHHRAVVVPLPFYQREKKN